MKEDSIRIDDTEEQILSPDISDETMERAAGGIGNYSSTVRAVDSTCITGQIISA